MIILDTNVISELLTPEPNAAVIEWLAAQHPLSVFTTAVTEAEILYGLRLLPEGRRRRDLEAAILPIFSEDIGGRAGLAIRSRRRRRLRGHRRRLP